MSMTNPTPSEASLTALAEEAAVEAIALEHGPLQYAEQARDGKWPIFRAARTAALIAARSIAASNSGGEG